MDLTLQEKSDLGKSLIILGRKLRDGVDPEISEATLKALLALTPNLPAVEEPKFIRQPKTDELMSLILNWVKNGESIPTGATHKAIQNALTKLRRNGQIINEGTVRNPKWRLATPEEQARISKEVRKRRKEYDLARAANSK